MSVQPYLFLQGRADEAIAFYEKALGAKRIHLMRFKDNPDGPAPPERADKVMHASLEIGGQVILLSDGHGSEGPRFEGFALTLTVAEAAQADRAFEALSEGGRVVQPLQKTFFSERFGMTQDPFGVLWIILVG
ncbi:MAG: VOC family protein [Methylocystis sp.]